MKVKARDIIPGWPRGRSTSSRLLTRGLWLNWKWIRAQSEEDPDQRLSARQKLLELELSIEYHEAQQRMIDEHFAQWRQTPMPLYFPVRFETIYWPPPKNFLADRPEWPRPARIDILFNPAS